jgi:hypothetical protein
VPDERLTARFSQAGDGSGLAAKRRNHRGLYFVSFNRDAGISSLIWQTRGAHRSHSRPGGGRLASFLAHAQRQLIGKCFCSTVWTATMCSRCTDLLITESLGSGDPPFASHGVSRRRVVPYHCATVMVSTSSHHWQGPAHRSLASILGEESKVEIKRRACLVEKFGRNALSCATPID